MAKIATYVNDTDVVGADKWIGSDSQNLWKTKNFTADSVAEYMNRIATQSQCLRYIYSTAPTAGLVRPTSSISFVAGGAYTVPLNNITTILLSKKALNVGDSKIDVSAWYTAPLKGSDVLLTQCNDLTVWAVYSWTNSVQNGSEPNFYDISLTYKAGNGSLTEDEDYFISLLTYDTASTNDKYFTAVLNGNASTYTISHNLNKYCSVTVTEKDGANDPTDEIKCAVVYLNLNQVRIDFETLFNGVIMCN
jgi:hypothetical protein|tara:strand:+ start:2669 stop:3415 length:747 start_codon:yes stop_codon:yes gene_type:complete